MTWQALANIGANLSVDGESIEPLTLIGLANTCASKGTHLTVRNASNVNSLTLQGLATTLGSNLTVED